MTGFRPVVGITCYLEPARWGVWDSLAALLPDGYLRMVTQAGGRPVLLPPDPRTAGAASAGAASAVDLVRRLDALVLAGGADVDPARYGAPAHASTVSRPERDAAELTILAAALELDLPVLGVCRGAELLAVAYGGTLHQHLPDLLGTSDQLGRADLLGDPDLAGGPQRHQPGPGVYGRHGVRFVPGSLAAAVHGGYAQVNSYHHQAIDDPGRLLVTGRADDGVVEAVEDPARRFVLGVQWHPEAEADVRTFAALVSAAREPGHRRCPGIPPEDRIGSQP